MLSEKELMLLELASDGEVVDTGDDTPVDETVDDSTVSEGTEVEETTESDLPVNEFDIDGEKLTKEQIKEYRQGYLRQSDYTKKTQEISALRQQHKEALELYDFLRANPHITEQLAQLEPTKAGLVNKTPDPMVQQMAVQLKTMEIDNALNQIKISDPGADEIGILNIASQNNCDINTAYNIWRGQNFDKILKERLEKQSSDITNKIKQNAQVTKTMITPKDKPADATFGLSEIELSMANKLGLSPKEYAEWK